ncbi:MAG TPA: rhomboid family intramembrane serine protease [Flavobacteriales bacterium]|nr:rhomboid family intramembrane serine protease [Flavobacteriales bacterium]MCB9181228.1 rhomboid family intramembrane serine protease [Flavobacteriales bacterium]MCB9199393.1 rhomboid family intramembrane serine protease [Flavobacteriales bacterium]HOP42117.1 rhomboid family intramembrane serine protease [Flavobacteriales bacterium]HPF66692.1 rhomboid family intramembrane serine protease [Flavobacteriales bacterium]
MGFSITLLIIIVTALVSIGAWQDRRVFLALLFEPFVIRARGEWHRFVTHAFIHADGYHLFVNMFVLYMFGANVERLYQGLTDGSGALAFSGLYLGGILFSSLVGYRRHIHDPGYRAVGASGAVAAVLFAHILMLPTQSIYLMFIPIPIPSFVFGILYLAYERYMDKRGGDNVAHDAHFHGALFGVVYTAIVEPRLVLELGYLQGGL